MAQFPRTVTLADKFRIILRAIYPDRPALADEIQSYAWDHFQGTRWWFETNLTSEEIIAVNKAIESLNDLVVVRGKIPLCGAPGPSKPLQDIEPAEVRGSKLHVFDGELRVFVGNKHIRTYY